MADTFGGDGDFGGNGGIFGGDTMATTLIGKDTQATGAADNTGGGDAIAQPYVCSSSGTVDTLHFFETTAADSGMANVELGIFADNAGVPGTLLGSGTVAGSPPANAWVDCPITAASGQSLAIVSGTKYWLAFVYPSSATRNLFFNDGLESTNVYVLAATAGFANNPTVTFGPATVGDLSIYGSATGVAADLNVSVSSATTTAETRTTVITRTVSAANSVTTGEAFAVGVLTPGAVTTNSSVSTAESFALSIVSPGVSVSDSTSTSEFFVVASDPPITFTLEVNLSDTVTTGEPLTIVVVPSGTLTVNVASTVTTANTPTIAAPLLPGISVSDSTTTADVGVAQLATLNLIQVSAADSITTASTSLGLSLSTSADLSMSVGDTTATHEVWSVGQPNPMLPGVVRDSTATAEFRKIRIVTPGQGSFALTSSGFFGG